MRAFGKRSAKAVTASNLVRSRQHAALQFEVVETASAACAASASLDNGLGGERLFIAQPEPVVRVTRVGPVAEIGLCAVADVEKIAKDFHRIALLSLS